MTLPPLILAVAASPDEGTQFAIIRFFLESGPLAWIVLGILMTFSVASWTIMIRKATYFRRVRGHNRRFLEVFRRSARFSEINAVTGRYAASPLVGLFQAGYLEIDSQVKTAAETGGNPGARYRVRSLTAVERSLRRAIAVEQQVLARSTPFLATTAAATPFIGLFGTVWGIMIAFNDIGVTGTASIVAVAPGIAEALINTAAGLVAAIPALIGYNQIAGRIRLMRSEMDDFALEFLNLTERNFT
jgi:biopolymer transport protein TolQ